VRINGGADHRAAVNGIAYSTRKLSSVRSVIGCSVDSSSTRSVSYSFGSFSSIPNPSVAFPRPCRAYIPMLIINYDSLFTNECESMMTPTVRKPVSCQLDTGTAYKTKFNTSYPLDRMALWFGHDAPALFVTFCKETGMACRRWRRGGTRDRGWVGLALGRG
jgi:hypothetical protein